MNTIVFLCNYLCNGFTCVYELPQTRRDNSHFFASAIAPSTGKITMHEQYLTVIKTRPLRLAMDQAVDLSLTTLSSILLKAQFPQL